MKWQGRQTSSNVNDQRGKRAVSGRAKAVGGGGIGLVIALVMFLLTGDPGALFGGAGVQQAPQAQQQEYRETELEQQLFTYAGVAMKDIEDTWNTILPLHGETYKEPTLTVYSGAIDTGCGAANSGVGPFYCTLDNNIYLDLSFYNTLVSRYGAKQGDFIMAYVIAHEAGHHVQTLLGVTDQLSRQRQLASRGQLSEADFNELSVRYELQADYLAGVVARHISDSGNLEQGDIAEAMSAAAAVGDDSIQMKAQGYVDPDSFNHGTSRQRQEWFQKGFDAGNLDDWDTFSVPI